MESKKRKAEELLAEQDSSNGDGAAEHKVSRADESSEGADHPPQSTTSTITSNEAETPRHTIGAVAGSGFSAYAKINPFAMATAGAKSSSFGFNISTTPKDSLRPNFTMPAPLTVPSPKSPRANPFSSPSPAHNPFMTIVESKDELWKAMAKDKLSDEEAAKTSLFEVAAKKPRKVGYGFGDSREAAASTETTTKSLFDKANDEDCENDEEGDEPAEGDTGSPHVVYTTYALPECSVILTGEEQEDCMLQMRAKLFRLNYRDKGGSEKPATSDEKASQQSPEEESKSEARGMDSAEWVEVGVGPLKVLKTRQSLSTPSATIASNEQDASSKDDRETSTRNGSRLTQRVVMRREDKKGGIGTKLLLNIRLDQYTSVATASDKALRVMGMSYREDGAGSLNTYLIKAKTEQECTLLLNTLKEGLDRQRACQ